MRFRLNSLKNNGMIFTGQPALNCPAIIYIKNGLMFFFKRFHAIYQCLNTCFGHCIVD